jgi:hypothetical protein
MLRGLVEHSREPRVLEVSTLQFMQIQRFHSVRFLCAFALTAIALGGVAGCTQVQVAPDVRGEYKLGELQVFADRDFMRVYEAAKAGMKDMKLFQTQDDRKVIEAELRGRDSVDTLVIVKIKEVAKGRTSVKIRYGALKPDLPSAQKLYDAILKHM